MFRNLMKPQKSAHHHYAPSSPLRGGCRYLTIRASRAGAGELHPVLEQVTPKRRQHLSCLRNTWGIKSTLQRSLASDASLIFRMRRFPQQRMRRRFQVIKSTRPKVMC